MTRHIGKDRDQIIPGWERQVHKILRILYILGLVVLVLSGAVYALNQKIPKGGYGNFPIAYGRVQGNEKLLVFLDREVGLPFLVGRNGLKFNIQNPNQEGYQLTLESNEGYRGNFLILPGTNRVEVPVAKGPAFLHWSWDKIPDGIIASKLLTPEYKWAVRSIYFLGGLSFLLCVYFFLRSPPFLFGEIFVIVFIMLFSVYFYVFHNAVIPLTGDEPHYLIQSQSIAHDGDLDLTNDYRDRNYALFFPEIIDAHTYRSGEKEYSIHYPLLSVGLSPVFWDRFLGIQIHPYVVAKMVIILIASLLGSWVICSVWVVSQKTSVVVFTTIQFVSLPFLSYTNQIYPELPASVLVLVIFLGMTGIVDLRRNHNSFVMLISILCLPFLHIKFSMVSLIAGIFLLYWNFGNARRLLVVVLSLIIGAVGILFYNMGIYGQILGPYSGSSISHFGDLMIRYLAYLIDTNFGLFPLSPLLLWTIPGFFVLYAKVRSPYAFFSIVALILVAHLMNLFHDTWLLGSSPVGRYWMAIAPVLIYISALGFQAGILAVQSHQSKCVRFLILGLNLLLLTVHGYHFYLYAFVNQAYYYPSTMHSGIRNGTSEILLASILDSLLWTYPDPIPWGSISLGILGIIVFSYMGVLSRRQMVDTRNEKE